MSWGGCPQGLQPHWRAFPRVVFLTKLADYGVETFRLTPQDLEQETPLA
jgi:hypothetical protein